MVDEPRHTDSSRRRYAVWYGGYFGLLVVYYVASLLWDVAPAFGTNISTVLGIQIIPDLCAAYLVGRVFWIAVFQERTFADLKRRLKRELLTRGTAERLIGIPVLILGTVVAFDIFGAFKAAIPVLGTYQWDETFARWDAFLHLGRDPWRWTHWMSTDSAAFHFLDQVYAGWFPVLVLSFLIFATWAPLALRVRFFWSLNVLLMVAGSLLAITLASAGPAYYAQFTGDVERFAPLMERLAGTDAVVHQNNLWVAYSTAAEKLYGGISAMPSMHVTLTILMAQAFGAWNRWVGAVAWGYAALILIGSVHLGWHYAVDGYLGILLALGTWAGVAWVVERHARENELPEGDAA